MTLHHLAHCLTSFCEFRRVQGWKFGSELSGSGQASTVRGSVLVVLSSWGYLPDPSPCTFVRLFALLSL